MINVFVSSVLIEDSIKREFIMVHEHIFHILLHPWKSGKEMVIKLNCWGLTGLAGPYLWKTRKGYIDALYRVSLYRSALLGMASTWHHEYRGSSCRCT